jgi:hypothetical protein
MINLEWVVQLAKKSVGREKQRGADKQYCGECRMDSSFEQACKPPGNGLQWHGVEIISSSGLPETNCDAAANDKVEGLDMKFEFVSTNPLICPPLDIPQVPKFEEQCCGGTDVTKKLLPGPAQLPFHPQLPVSIAGMETHSRLYFYGALYFEIPPAMQS